MNQFIEQLRQSENLKDLLTLFMINLEAGNENAVLEYSEQILESIQNQRTDNLDGLHLLEETMRNLNFCGEQDETRSIFKKLEEKKASLERISSLAEEMRTDLIACGRWMF